jgi:ABC-type uncharacterized transport system substrate-binding protein
LPKSARQCGRENKEFWICVCGAAFRFWIKEKITWIRKLGSDFWILLPDNPKSKIENLKWVGTFAIALTFAMGGAVVEAQQAKTALIGWLTTGSASNNKSRDDVFRQGLRQLGYVERKNFVIEYRYADGKRERYPDLAAEMVRLKPDVIVVGSIGFTAAVKQATSTIPIVVGGAGDIVGEGLVASLARPGGNITGFTNISPDLSGKRLELLKEAVPKASRVAVL